MAADIETDVLVAGAGMAGLVTAVEAVDRGASVVVLEKGPRPGGTMYISAGVIWTYGSYEEARKAVPKGDPKLHRLTVDKIQDGFEWLKDHGIELSGLPFTFPSGEEFGVSLYDDRQAKQMEPEAFTERMVETLEDNGGEVHTETPFSDLVIKDDTVVGATATDPSGDQLNITAESVVLATGGFQGNEELLQRYVTENTDNLWLRSNPWSTGDAFLAATAAGAKTAGDLSTFSGPHLLAPPASFSSSEYLQVTQSHASFGLAIDKHGERVHDESESSVEYPLVQDIARNADGEAYVIIDHEAYQTSHLGGEPLGERIQASVDEYGGRTAMADSFEELQEVLFQWGVNGERAIETIRKFNQAMENKAGDRLDPPRRGSQTTVSEPPFNVLAVQPAITYTNGGLAVTERMEVVARTSMPTSMEPYERGPDIPDPYGSDEDRTASVKKGLYAAGVDVGNISHDHYHGSLGPSLVMGRIAGKEASDRAK